MSVTDQSKPSDLSWLLDDLTSRVVGARYAVVLSTDGLLVARSRNVSREDGEHLSAMASAFQSLARGVGRQFDGGEVQQTVVELTKSFLVVTAAANQACLAVLCDAEADIGIVAYEMNMMIKQVGAYFATRPRSQA